MNTLNIIKTLGFSSCILALLSLPACKKSSTEAATASTAATGTVLLHLHTNVDTNEVDTYGHVYFMTGGRKISLNLAQLYLSNIQLVKTDGTTYDLTGINILKVMEVEEYLLGSVPVGNYRSIRFNVGLAPVTNSSTPAVNDSTLNKPNMWFGNAAQPSGYIFVNFQGMIDTSTAANNTVAQMQPFKYKIGTNTNLKNVILPNQNYSILPNQAQYIHITIDYSKLFNGVQINNANNLMVNTIPDNINSLGILISNNIPAMFRYEL